MTGKTGKQDLETLGHGCGEIGRINMNLELTYMEQEISDSAEFVPEVARFVEGAERLAPNGVESVLKPVIGNKAAHLFGEVGWAALKDAALMFFPFHGTVETLIHEIGEMNASKRVSGSDALLYRSYGSPVIRLDKRAIH